MKKQSNDGKKTDAVKKTASFDWIVLIVALLLFSCGIVCVYSSSFAIAQMHRGNASFFLLQHAVRGGLALILLYFFIHIDYHLISRTGNLLYVVSILLLGYLLLQPESAAINGAKRWLSIGSTRFQVSEMARIALILYLARQSEKLGEKITEMRTYIIQLVKIGLMCLLILLEPNFSTAAILGLTGMLMLFVGGARMKHIAMTVGLMIPAAVITALSSSYRYKRVASFLNLSGAHETQSYQIGQSLIGLGNGGLWGTGIGAGQQKYFFLPEPHTDFIFAILGEEVGFIGLVVVLALFCLLLFRGIRIAFAAPDRMGQMLGFGIVITIAVYLLLHASVNIGIVPTTGVPMPFLSYGGMSLIFTMGSIGVLLNISMHAKETPFSMKRSKI